MHWLRRLTTPPQLRFLAPLHPLAFLSGAIATLDSVSTYALVYIGVTGDGFWPSARRARGIVPNPGAKSARIVDDEDENIAPSRRRRRPQARRISDCRQLPKNGGKIADLICQIQWCQTCCHSRLCLWLFSLPLEATCMRHIHSRALRMLRLLLLHVAVSPSSPSSSV